MKLYTWWMIGGVALFVVSFTFHFLVSTFTGKQEAYIISLGLFISPLIILIGIALYIMANRKQK
ncbi:MAG: hypothetical protein NT082_07315 [Chloroflexi bacterium]|nr:hypothetical protein [Chloroflexota bacterium]